MKKTVFLLAIFGMFILSADFVFAGFGISPPYVKNENLGQGSHYEKKIILVRSDPIEDWKIEIITNVPGADNWISVDKGKEFIMPKGAQQVPIIFSVDVPKNAKFSRYTGSIRVKTAPLTPPEPGTVSILLGGQIDVDLNVTKEVFDFQVRGVKVVDLEEGHKTWWRFVPGIIKFSIQIENLGNIKAAPSKVTFEIYDEYEKEIVEKIETTKIGKVKPFKTEWVITELKTRLKPGSYWAQYKIFKKDEVANAGKIHLSILPYGTLPKVENKFLGLNIWYWVGIGIVVLAGILVGIGYQGYRFWKKRKYTDIHK